MLDKDKGQVFIKIDDLIEVNAKTAISYIEKAREEKSLSSDILDILEVRSLAKLNNWNEVVDVIEKSSSELNKDFNISYYYIEALFKLGRYSGALNYINNILINSNNYFHDLALLNLAKNYFQLNEIKSVGFRIQKIYSFLGFKHDRNISLEDQLIQCKRENVNSNRNYSILLLEVNENENLNEIKQLIKYYIENEKLGYYRNMALELLSSFE